MRHPELRILERRERRAMHSTVRVTRPAGGSVDADGDLSKSGTQMYSGKATVARADTTTMTTTHGAQANVSAEYLVILPRGANALAKDVVEVTASPDPALVGKYLRVVDDGGSEWSTNRMLRCEAVA